MDLDPTSAGYGFGVYYDSLNLFGTGASRVTSRTFVITYKTVTGVGADTIEATYTVEVTLKDPCADSTALDINLPTPPDIDYIVYDDADTWTYTAATLTGDPGVPALCGAILYEVKYVDSLIAEYTVTTATSPVSLVVSSTTRTLGVFDETQARIGLVGTYTIRAYLQNYEGVHDVTASGTVTYLNPCQTPFAITVQNSAT